MVDVAFRVKPNASPGVQLLDLEWVELNEGGLTLNPAPKLGPDPTDAVLTIQATPNVAATKLASTKAASSGMLPGIPTTSQPTGRSTMDVSAPVIDWSVHEAAAPIGPKVDPVRVGPKTGWVTDFVNGLGQSEDDRNPNAKISLKLPVVQTISKLASKLGKLVR